MIVMMERMPHRDRRSRLFGRAAIVALLIVASCSIGTAAQVSVVLFTEKPGMQVQEWLRVFEELKVVDLQIRGGSGNDKIEITKIGAGQGTTYRVTGMLTTRNEVILPNGRYKTSDRAKLAEWFNTLRVDGIDRAMGVPRPPFGMSPEDLKSLREEFAQPINFDTKDMPLRTFLDKVATRLKSPIVADRGATAAVALPENNLRDELRGIATGAALVAALRPAGLLLVPRLDGQRKPELGVVVSGQSKEFWPLGWTPSAERPEAALLPAMHEIRDVELDEVPIMDLVGAIAERLKTPVLIDHNGLARQGLDPAKVKVSMPAAKSTYGLTLGRMLAKARLRYEVRIDDAGKPFIWIMSLV